MGFIKDFKMILTEIKHYIMEHSQVSLRDLSLHFDAGPGVMKDMLGHWIRKGKVQKVEIDACRGCSSCKSCDETELEFYRWNDEPEKISSNIFQ